jgi:hypothetical protein
VPTCFQFILSPEFSFFIFRYSKICLAELDPTQLIAAQPIYAYPERGRWQELVVGDQSGCEAGSQSAAPALAHHGDHHQGEHVQLGHAIRNSSKSLSSDFIKRCYLSAQRPG